MITRIDTEKENSDWKKFAEKINKLAREKNVTNDKGKIVEITELSEYFENITGIVKLA